jgi:hypothetical protein
MLSSTRPWLPLLAAAAVALAVMAVRESSRPPPAPGAGALAPGDRLTEAEAEAAYPPPEWEAARGPEDSALLYFNSHTSREYVTVVLRRSRGGGLIVWRVSRSYRGRDE